MPVRTEEARSQTARTLVVDSSAVESPSLRREIRDALDRVATLTLREGAFRPDSWLHQSREAEPILLLADLTVLDEALAAPAHGPWAAAFRGRPTWTVAFLRTPEDRARAHRTESIFRLLDGRLTLLPDPESKGSGDPGRLPRWLQTIVGLLEAQALLEVRPLPPSAPGSEATALPRLLLRFGDDWTVTVPAARLLPALGSLGASATEHGGRPHLLWEAAQPGPGGRTLEVPSRDGPERDLSLDGATLRKALGSSAGSGGLDTTESVPDPGAAPSTGTRIRAARTAQGISQMDLAQRSGFHQAVISNLERDVHDPRLDTLRRVATGMGLSLTELLNWPVREPVSGSGQGSMPESGRGGASGSAGGPAAESDQGSGSAGRPGPESGEA